MEKDTEQQILEAARKIFQKQGFAGARMQEIADAAGINKSMLHYYFRSKDKLFQKIFQEGVSRFFPLIMRVLNADKTLEEKITVLVQEYLDFLRVNRQLPHFVIHEMNQHPKRFREFMEEKDMEIPSSFVEQVLEAVHKGRIQPVTPAQLLVNIISLCVFPFLAQNMVMAVMQMDEEQFDEFIEHRHKELPTFILNAIRTS